MSMEISEINKLIESVLGKGAEIVSPLVGGMMNISYIVKIVMGRNMCSIFLPNKPMKWLIVH